ncbi:MAG: TolB family protein, partial [Chitinophagaceae bacterium]
MTRNLQKLFPVLLIICISCSKSDDKPTVIPEPTGYISFQEELQSSYTTITTIKADGSEQTPLSLDNSIPGFTLRHTTPDLSFDGKKIAFTSNRDGEQNEYDIYIMNKDGTDIKKITDRPDRSEEFPVLSPNGQKLLFSAPDANNNLQIYISNADGTNEQMLTNISTPGRKVFSSRPCWSEDGTKIGFICNKESIQYNMYVMNSDGSNVKRVAPSDSESQFCASLSPNGQKLAYYKRVNGAVEIFVINSNGTNDVQLTTYGRLSADPVWSPDGNYIAFLSDKDKPVGTFAFDLYLMKANGT